MQNRSVTNGNSGTVRQERTGWRDEWISNRHRAWGWDCPMVDIDFLALEYDQAKPVALVEYKAKGAAKPDLAKPSYRALRGLADIGKLPFAIVFYHPGLMVFWVIAGNEAARFAFPCQTVLSEYDFVQALYRLRKRNMPEVLTRTLSRKKDIPA